MLGGPAWCMSTWFLSDWLRVQWSTIFAWVPFLGAREPSAPHCSLDVGSRLGSRSSLRFRLFVLKGELLL
ncbi:hypothetical protein M758_UG139700 [Ceratodon purpureus]|nr:hypothetical protein M758_UG139700 [Ceratodon purpureus]